MVVGNKIGLGMGWGCVAGSVSHVIFRLRYVEAGCLFPYLFDQCRTTGSMTEVGLVGGLGGFCLLFCLSVMLSATCYLHEIEWLGATEYRVLVFLITGTATGSN
ncbi:hypothetical protein VTJ04DRAFT_9604 [Mycothermus thermophilus]|uniref:uncharacterized protein n=1 Tax=Humicola insolens TaxID=85995 RepID=UPI0037437622